MRQINHKKPNRIIAELLRSLGIPAQQAAFDLGIPLAAFSRIINGWETPCEAKRKMICRYLDQPESILFPQAQASPSSPCLDLADIAA